MRIIVFGVGKFYLARKEEFRKLSNDDTLVAYFDNKFIARTSIDGVPAINPNQCASFEFDCVIIMSIYINEIRKQLNGLGISDEKIYTWKKYVAHKNNGFVKRTFTSFPGAEKKILIVTIHVDYNGGVLQS